jgi:hypothetical protein
MKKLFLSLSLLAMSFSSAAFDFSESDLQSYMKALPAVTSWADDQDSLGGLDLGDMLGTSAASTSDQSSMISSAVSLLKAQDLYTSLAGVTSSFGFTPEQLFTIGSEVSMAYVENLKSGLSEENQATVNTVMGGLSAMKTAKDTSSLLGSFGKSSSDEEEAAESAVSESNLSLVSEYMPQLEQLFTLL